MMLHHSKHHATYVNNLNDAEAKLLSAQSKGKAFISKIGKEKWHKTKKIALVYYYYLYIYIQYVYIMYICMATTGHGSIVDHILPMCVDATNGTVELKKFSNN